MVDSGAILRVDIGFFSLSLSLSLYLPLGIARSLSLSLSPLPLSVSLSLFAYLEPCFSLYTSESSFKEHGPKKRGSSTRSGALRTVQPRSLRQPDLESEHRVNWDPVLNPGWMKRLSPIPAPTAQPRISEHPFWVFLF